MIRLTIRSDADAAQGAAFSRGGNQSLECFVWSIAVLCVNAASSAVLGGAAERFGRLWLQSKVRHIGLHFGFRDRTHQAFFSSTKSNCPSLTTSFSLMQTSAIRPLKGARMACSIFIASRFATSSPL
ncbi:MAG: hypothetical protein KatS3mg058_3460 [Roseiflexus sp.]|nr:MAG: hypothetical protein KatS3mg058_3460 [Roseiflexus sp.]